MAMDWLALWGVQTAVGFLFTPVMQKFAEDLGKDVLKDVLKDVIKGLPGNILQSLQKEELDKAVGKAIKEFLEIFQQELVNADLEDDKIQAYNQPLTKFLRIDEVKQILGCAFHLESTGIDTKQLEKIWYDKNLLPLPEDFDWRRLNKPYIKKVKAIIRESEKLRTVFDSYQIEKTATKTQEIAGVPTDFDLQRYQEAIRQKYKYLQLDSLDTSGAAYNELKLQQVFICQNVRECVEVLPHVFERSKEYYKYLQETGQEEEINRQLIYAEELKDYQQRYIEAPICPVIDILNESKISGDRSYFVILGDPGAGKSTLLQFLAINWAESPLTNHFNQPIPILIELRNYVRQLTARHCTSFLEYLHKAPGTICHLNQLQLHQQLQAGNVLMMFDGLDEIFNPAQREDIVNDIIRFTDKYPNIQVIVTSRIIGYKDERFRNSEFRHLMLQDFDSDQIQDFINRWHQLTFNDKSDATAKQTRLEKAIQRSKPIQELAGNPLLLTMMAILNRHRELPRDRTTLYEKASEVLLQQWDAERHLIDAKMSRFSIDLTDKQAMLRQIAYHMQANEKGLTGNLINGDDLQRIFQDYLETIGYSKIDAREAAKVLIQQLRERNFILCHAGDNYYAFVHRTFLEYFCAEAFRWQFEREQKLTLKQLKSDVFGQHWQDESWHEVLKLISGAINVKFVAEILDYLMGIDGEEESFQNLFLAAGCLAEVRERNNREILEQDRNLFVAINDLIKRGYAWELYYDSLYDTYEYLTDELEEEIPRHDKILSLAVETINLTWIDNANILSYLKKYTQSDSYNVRNAAVRELVKYYGSDSETFVWLKQQVDSKLEYDVTSVYKDNRRIILQELARHQRCKPNILELLKQYARSGSDALVRSVSLQELALNFQDDPDTIAILKQNALYDDDFVVRNVALRELAQNYKDETGIFELLCSIAVNDPFEFDILPKIFHELQTHPRQTALEAILKNYPKHPQTLPLLRDRAKNDPDEKLREWAQKKLNRLEAQI